MKNSCKQGVNDNIFDKELQLSTIEYKTVFRVSFSSGFNPNPLHYSPIDSAITSSHMQSEIVSLGFTMHILRCHIFITQHRSEYSGESWMGTVG